jgi:hypothetical protein
MIDDATLLAFSGFRECGRTRCFFPGSSEIRRAKDRRTEVARLRCGEECPPIARIVHHVVDDVTEEVRTVDSESLSRAVGVEEPRTFSRRDEDDDASWWA